MSHRTRRAAANRICPVCGLPKPDDQMIPGSLVRRAVAALIQLDHPEWSAGDEVCLSDLHTYRLHYLQNILKSEKGELSYLDQEVVEHIRQNELIAENISDDLDQKMTRGERVADRIASFGGSWKFLGIFGATIVLWMFVNSLLLINKPFDPYPFILLNLVLSCLAAIQAPVIMMSQNRSETKDRARSEHDYQVNLKAELEIRLLHDKMDHLLLHQWQQLMEVQEIQADLMDELATKLDSRR